MEPGAAGAQPLGTPMTDAMAFADVRMPFIRSRARAALGRSRPADADELLLVTETSFFRYEHQHRILTEIALPAAARAASAQSRAIRILSAGCATGEEAYSIAMTVHQDRETVAGAEVEILAVDMSQDAVDAAAKGIYPTACLAGVPPAYVSRYFSQRPEGFSVAPELRGMVKFLRYDIRDGLYLGKFDVVFCCNVLLYFVPDVKAQIVRHLAALVRRDGHLFLGHADGAELPADLFETSKLPSFVYRRR